MDSEQGAQRSAKNKSDQVKNIKVSAEDKREVKARWLDMQLARKNFDYVAAIFGQNLPKVAYSKRKNGVKKRLNATKNDRRSKYMQWFGHYMQAGQILKQAETAFQDVLKAQQDKGIKPEQLVSV